MQRFFDESPRVMPSGELRVPLRDLMALGDLEHDRVLGDGISTSVKIFANDEEVREEFDASFYSTSMPSRCGDFDLTDAQKQVIMYISSSVLAPIVVHGGVPASGVQGVMGNVGNVARNSSGQAIINLQSDDEGDEDDAEEAYMERPAKFRRICLQNNKLHVVCSQVRGEIPSLSVLSLGPGMGKTVITLCAAIRIMTEEWGGLLSKAWTLVGQRTSSAASGLCMRDASSSNIEAANLSIFFVPSHLEEQWVSAAMSVLRTWSRNSEAGRKVQLWVGHEDEKHSVQAALEKSKVCATIWILPLGPKSMNVLYTHPDVAIACVVYDECVHKIGGKQGQMRASPILGPTIIAQATIDRLDNSMIGNPSHPLRSAMQNMLIRDVHIAELNRAYATGGGGYSDFRAKLKARVHLEALLLPSFLTMRVRNDAMRRMPLGLRVLDVGFVPGDMTIRMGETTSTTANTLEQNVELLRDFLSRVFSVGQSQSAAIPPEVECILENDPGCLLHAPTLITALERVGTRASKAAARGIRRFKSREVCCMICYSTSLPLLRQSRCCGAIYCADCLDRVRASVHMQSTCSFCITEQPEPLVPPRCIIRDPPPAPLATPTFQTGEDFALCVRRITEAKLSGVDAAVCAVDAAVKTVAGGTSARVLVFFDHSTQDPRILEKKVTEAVPNVVVVNMESTSRSIKRIARQAMKRYNDLAWGENIVFMCSTAKASLSIAGLDLVNTHATIVCGCVDAANEQQMVGRVMRMTSHTEFQKRYALFARLLPIISPSTQEQDVDDSA